MIALYRVIVGLLFWTLFPVLLLIVILSGKHRRGLGERLALATPVIRSSKSGAIIWIHAASIGEVRAARIVIDHCTRNWPESSVVLTTMTIHGRDYARTILPDSVFCLLAPLDVPFVVERAIKRLRPTIYVCLETELWPLLVAALHRRGIGTALLNGRISTRSLPRYRRWRTLFGTVLNCFDGIGVISDEDRSRFLEIGADSSRLRVTGNIKYDYPPPHRREGVTQRYRKRLSLEAGDEVFIAGSTHSPEERLLLEEFGGRPDLQEMVWLIAPRHLKRVAEIEALLAQMKIGYDKLSTLSEEYSRRHRLVLVDTMGDLADLYEVGTYIFIGGSIAEYGGHNLMEAARRHKPVFFGPHVEDFKDGATALIDQGGGFQIDSATDLFTHIEQLYHNRNSLTAAGQAAGKVAGSCRGAVGRQMEIIGEIFDEKSKNER
ncbi:MAG TPA: hypothetical protein DDX99_10895 [Desulfofustis sp.]|jgi:3-deoxy-D-manno-octulosonic-acid transferase|nr:hypothetical protein [Desulfofustis sp. PB-SRB1]HBH29336.1 hypothetical protein [Desulfofustis sp.]